MRKKIQRSLVPAFLTAALLIVLGGCSSVGVGVSVPIGGPFGVGVGVRSDGSVGASVGASAGGVGVGVGASTRLPQPGAAASSAK